eukprot:Tamp_17988.p1 GENE.Tamp_17988~~Tamp_17988.p1  ORF type:complete len:395 (+),score=27.71 Tamp_17988:132-1316(+)
MKPAPKRRMVSVCISLSFSLPAPKRRMDPPPLKSNGVWRNSTGSASSGGSAGNRSSGGGGLFDNLSEAYKEHHIINDFIFPGSSASSYSWDSFNPGELICIESGGDENLIIPCLLLKGTAPTRATASAPEEGRDQPPAEPASSLLIYCHANSEDLGSIYSCAQWLCQMLGVHVLVPEYPGYGLCAGNPCESSVNAAVLAACHWARDALKWDPDHIVIYGRSIGTGPAIYAARLGLVSGVVLVSPYTSIREIVQEHVGSVISWLTAGSSDWNSMHMMKEVQCPVLMIHGTTDEIIPCSHSKALHSACKAPKRLILLEKVGHQEMELLYALVQASPGMFCLYDKPSALDLTDMTPLIVSHRGASNGVPVYASSPQRSLWGDNAGEMVIGGRSVFVL